MARLDKERWAIIRYKWESDERTGYAWIVNENALKVTPKAVALRAKNEEWAKKKPKELPQNFPRTSPETQEEVIEEVVSNKKPLGRPTKYREDYNDQVFKLALLGLTDEKMAEVIGISIPVFYEWKVRYPEFQESIKRGKAPADAEVAVSLYDSARGYAHEDVHISDYQGQTTVTPIIKRYPPNFQSASLWLRNRQPALWKANVEHREAPKNPFPPDAELDEVYLSGMAESARKEALMREQREKLGIDFSDLLVGKLDG